MDQKHEKLAKKYFDTEYNCAESEYLFHKAFNYGVTQRGTAFRI